MKRQAAAEAAHWSPLEAEPWERIQGRQLELLNAQLDYLWARSPFHQKKLREAGLEPSFRVKTWEDLSQIPMTTKYDLRESLRAAPPLGNHLVADRKDVIQVQATSGTTRSPSYFGLTAQDVDTWSEMGARCLVAGGFQPGDIVMHSWSLSKGFSGGVPAVRMIQYLGCCVLPIGAEAGALRILTVMKEQGATAAVGTPNFFTYLGDQAPGLIGTSISDLSVKHVVVGGEPGGGIQPIREAIQRSWGATCTEVLGNSDIAPLVWGECLDRSGMHFCGHDMVLVELVDPLTGDHIDPQKGAEGEIIYTSLRRQASPVLRFRSGDRVVVLDTDCSCGRASYKIRCVGRTDDMLIVRGVNVWPTAIQEIIVSHRPKSTGAMRIIVDFAGYSTNDRLRIQVERAADLTADDAQQLVNELTSAIRSNLVFNPVIELVEAGSLEPPGAGKVRLTERIT